MFKPKNLSKVRIIGVKSSLEAFIREMHGLKLMHLTDFRQKDDSALSIGTPFENATAYSETLIALRSLIDSLKLKSGEKSKTVSLNEVKKAQRIVSEIKGLTDRKKSLLQEKRGLEQMISKPAALFSVTKKDASKLSKVKAISGTIPREEFEKIKSSLSENDFREKDFDAKNKALLLFCLNEQEASVKAFLQKNGFAEEELLEEPVSRLKTRLSGVEKEIKSAERQLEAVKSREEEFLVSIEKALSIELEKAEAPLKFAFSSKGFIATGWIPDDKTGLLRKKIEKINGLIMESFEDKEDMPVLLDNPRPSGPFEFFLRLYTLPKNYEIDPTILVSITFPLFFGFMLGDVGYGLVILAVLYFLRKKFESPETKSFINVIMIASLASVLFGFIYGEFFGFYLPYTPLLHRGAEITFMMLLALLIGVIHINLGLLFGFINVYHCHGLKHAVTEKVSWILLELSVILYIMVNQPAGVVLAVISIGLLLKGKGIVGILEIPTLLGNILSYIRLFAIGLASLKLAEVVNQLAAPMFASFNPLLMIAAVFILLLGHAINIFLGVLGPFIQSTRLQYVEFFGKFFEGGGKEFKPFGV